MFHLLSTSNPDGHISSDIMGKSKTEIIKLKFCLLCNFIPTFA